MELYLDTADLTDIESYAQVLPLRGVTTNPSIVAKTNRSLPELIAAFEGILGPGMRYHAQVIATDYEGILREAETIHGLTDDMVVKIPVTREGFRAIKTLSRQGFNLTATAVYTAHQAFMAALCGASYVAPYVDRIDALSRDSLQVVDEIQTLFGHHRLSCKVLAASFKNANQVLGAFLTGIGAVTLPGDVLAQLLYSPATDVAVEEFLRDWEQAFGERNLV